MLAQGRVRDSRSEARKKIGGLSHLVTQLLGPAGSSREEAAPP